MSEIYKPDVDLEDLIEKLFNAGSETAGFEEISPTHHEHVREHIHSTFEDRYRKLKD